MLRRVKEARLPRLKTLQEFDFAQSPVSAARIADLAAGGYIARAEPVLLIGEAGTGKTHLASGLCVAACEQRRRVRFTTATALVNELVEARAANALSRALGRWERIELIGIDELGYVPLAELGAELLFQVIADRAERAAVIVTTNLPFSEWGQVLPNPRLCQALIDRLDRPCAHHRDRHRVVPLPQDPRRRPRHHLSRAGWALLHSPCGLRSRRPTQRKARADPKGGQHSLAQGGQVSLTRPAATMSEAPYVLDGLHHHAHQTDLRIAEHYTDTAGATDHVFGLCHLLNFRFAPRIKDLKERKLYATLKPATYPLLEPLIGDTVETAVIVDQWPALMRLKASIQAGSVAPSVILRKLAAAGAGNALSRALRALGRIERTLFTLQWLSDPDLRQRSHAGLNKGEASNSLRRAVFFHRQGEIRDRTFENQSFRASGLSLITAAIVHWNTVYLDRAVQHLRAHGVIVPDDLLAHVAPLGWEHIALTGDYVWADRNPGTAFRPLRDVRTVFLPQAA